MNNIAIELLITQRSKLLYERAKMNEVFSKDISEIETSIEQLSGKKVWEVIPDYIYDDENPNYIKASQEEM